MTVPALRTAAVVAATVTAAAAVAVFVLATRLPTLLSGDPSSSVAVVPFVLGMVLVSGTGAIVVRERPRSVVGWLMVGAGLAGVLGRLAFGLAVLVDDGENLLAPVLGWVTNWAWIPAQVLALLLLLRLPDGRLPGGRWRIVQTALLAWGAVAMGVTMTVPGPLAAEQLAPRTNPLGIALRGRCSRRRPHGAVRGAAGHPPGSGGRATGPLASHGRPGASPAAGRGRRAARPGGSGAAGARLRDRGSGRGAGLAARPRQPGVCRPPARAVGPGSAAPARPAA